MKLGIDFGTTRVVVSAADRGNYPIVSFDTPDGGTEEWFPPLVAVSGEKASFGWDAHQRQISPGSTIVRSLKRVLEDAGLNTKLEIAGQTYPLIELLRGVVNALRQALLHGSTLHLKVGEALEVTLGVPANANTNQRFLTAEVFRQCGFEVLGILNEPSAASLEFGHRYKDELKDQERMLVYDLGGGTFDASLVLRESNSHIVLATEGITTLGGDDFDEVLAGLALRAAGLTMESLSAAEAFQLLEECRVKKESLHPNTRKIVIDLEGVRDGLSAVTIPVPEYYEAAKPLVEETVQAVRDLLRGVDADGVEWLYVTGGGSELPLVSRLLKEEFGRKVKRSAYTRSATAIGLAIQADHAAGFELREKFTRYFGVWREAEFGNRIVFDPLFSKSTPLPAVGEPALEIRRVYLPVHNIGHFRYLECSHLGADRQPRGDIQVWDEILFPFDPTLSEAEELRFKGVEIAPKVAGEEIEECYQCDSNGAVQVTIRNLTSGYERVWQLGRQTGKTKSMHPAKKRRARA